MRVFLLLLCAWAVQGKEFFDKTALRDPELLGNAKLAIGQFKAHTVPYGDSCLQISRWKESELVRVGMDGANKELSMVLELPVHIQQVKNDTKSAKPTKATVTVTYPKTLLKRTGDISLILDEEDVDALIDIEGSGSGIEQSLRCVPSPSDCVSLWRGSHCEG